MMPMDDLYDLPFQEDENVEASDQRDENTGSQGSGLCFDDDEDEVIDVREAMVVNAKKREVDLVTELIIKQDIDPNLDLVGEMFLRLMNQQGDKAAMKSKESLLCKQIFSLLSFLAIQEVHGTVNCVDMKNLYANANISFSRFYGGSLKLVAYWRDGFYAKLGGDLPKFFDAYVKDEREVHGKATWRTSKFLNGLDDNGKDHAKFGMTVWTKGVVFL
jgi:hypothetical protein